ncbi:MAG: FkbM family methyltransferase [Fimbriimonadaceae bacterium]|nr:FkbM family methyltransferase [Fimbriimonadaceae bacterium]
MAWLQKHLRSGDSFFDVGANVGAYTLIAARLVGPTGQVVAFEPGAPTFGALVRNVGMNRIANVVALPMALSDADGLVELRYPSDLPGETVCSTSEIPEMVSHCLSFRLDRAIESLGLRCPKLLKIDTDGFEEAVLAGAPCLLANPDLKGVLFEGYPGAPEAAAVVARLRAAGFAEEVVVSRGAGRVANFIFGRV